MAAIIHAPLVAAAGRQLRRPGTAAAVAAPAAPAPLEAAPPAEPPAAPASAVATAAQFRPAPDPEPSALQREAQRLREQAAQLETRAQALAAAEAAVQQQQQALAQQQQQLTLAQQKLQEEAGAVREAAERRGHAQGVQQGEDAAREASAAHGARLNAIVQALQHARQALLEEHQDMLVEISFAALCRVLGAQAATRAGLVSQVRSLIDGERDLEQLSVRLHPQDMALLAADRAGLDARLQLAADDSIALGGCLIDSPRGTLDARLEWQVQQLRSALTLTRDQQRQDEAPV